LIALVVLANLAFAQAPPRMSDGKPNFSGMWDSPQKVNTRGPRGGPGGRTFDPEKMAPFKPGGEALLYQVRTGDVRIDDPNGMRPAFSNTFARRTTGAPEAHAGQPTSKS